MLVPDLADWRRVRMPQMPNASAFELAPDGLQVAAAGQYASRQCLVAVGACAYRVASMAKNAASWRVLEHGPLEQLADNIWRVEGALPGMSLRRTMTVVRRGDGSLLLHSAIALDQVQQRRLEALGPLKVIVVPNAGHRLDAPAYKARYPEVLVVCPRGAREKVAHVVAVDLTYDDYADDGVIRCETLAGTADGEGTMIVTSTDGISVVLNDVVMMSQADVCANTGCDAQQTAFNTACTK